MPQEFQVLQCFSCQTFQVQQVKKATKWNCKMCGEKQSIKKVFGRGSGAECRQHVQKLNTLRGQTESRQSELNSVSDLFTGQDISVEDYGEDEPAQDLGPSKWTHYVDEPSVPEPPDTPTDEWDEPQFTTDRSIFSASRKGKKRKQPTQVAATNTSSGSNSKRRTFQNTVTGDDQYVSHAQPTYADDEEEEEEDGLLYGSNFKYGRKRPSSVMDSSQLLHNSEGQMTSGINHRSSDCFSGRKTNTRPDKTQNYHVFQSNALSKVCTEDDATIHQNGFAAPQEKSEFEFQRKLIRTDSSSRSTSRNSVTQNTGSSLSSSHGTKWDKYVIPSNASDDEDCGEQGEMDDYQYSKENLNVEKYKCTNRSTNDADNWARFNNQSLQYSEENLNSETSRTNGRTNEADKWARFNNYTMHCPDENSEENGTILDTQYDNSLSINLSTTLHPMPRPRIGCSGIASINGDDATDSEKSEFREFCKSGMRATDGKTRTVHGLQSEVEELANTSAKNQINFLNGEKPTTHTSYGASKARLGFRNETGQNETGQKGVNLKADGVRQGCTSVKMISQGQRSSQVGKYKSALTTKTPLFSLGDLNETDLDLDI